MEAAGHFVFMVFKIAILASIYALITLVLLSLLAKFYKVDYFTKILRNKKLSWFGLGFIISTLLLIYSFTYWGNHGLGDSARVPVGYWHAVGNTN